MLSYWNTEADVLLYLQVERERDKERLETKRRIEQMKKNADEEQEETKKKLHEVIHGFCSLFKSHSRYLIFFVL